MFGKKIIEFENSNGTIEDFNKIFPKTTITLALGHVEIGDIVDTENILTQNLFVRNITVKLMGGEGYSYEHDFGRRNFMLNEDFILADNIRFKYFAKDLEGNLIATGYNFREMAEKLNCNDNFLKSRIKNPVDSSYNGKYKFNISRKEI